jgi:hypothetical protein
MENETLLDIFACVERVEEWTNKKTVLTCDILISTP